jgi:hypothetical protein
MKSFLAALAVVTSFVVASPAVVHAQAPGASNSDVGTDPDPFIRSQLLRDDNWKYGGAD